MLLFYVSTRLKNAIKENVITKLQKFYSPPRNLRGGNKLPMLFLEKPLCMGDLWPAHKIFIQRPVPYHSFLTLCASFSKVLILFCFDFIPTSNNLIWPFLYTWEFVRYLFANLNWRNFGITQNLRSMWNRSFQTLVFVTWVSSVSDYICNRFSIMLAIKS